MHWFTILFVTLAVIAAVFSAHVAWRSRRDAANWAIDPASKQVRFQNWTEFAFASLVCVISCAVILVAVLT